MKKFFMQYRRALLALSALLFVGVAAMLMAGCGAPTWLTDANSIVATVGTSITAIGAFVAALTGNAALAALLTQVTDWITKIETGIGDIEALVAKYDASPNPTLLGEIEAALTDVETNLKQDFGNLGLPASVLSVIEGVAALALSQLQAWGSLIPALKAGAMAKFTIVAPYTKAEYKALVNGILSTVTGDPEVDAALAKVKKL